MNKEIQNYIDKQFNKLKLELSEFKRWTKIDSVKDIYSPVTSNSSQIGFFKTPKISQPTTGISGATFTANSGTAVNSASTFDGYTLAQVVKALRNLGLLA